MPQYQSDPAELELGTEPDVDWSVDPFDQEPEQLNCPLHDHELPCGGCDRAMQCWKEERRVV